MEREQEEMKYDPNLVKLVPLTNREIFITISMLRKTIPSHDEQDVVVGIVDKLNRAASQ